MSSSKKTPSISLSQFVAGIDRPAWLEDYNNDMSAIDACVGRLSEEIDNMFLSENTTVYVSPTGSDSAAKDAGTVLAPYRTIAYAIASLPTVINKTITLQLAEGTYAENVALSGFSGGGTIAVRGGADLNSASNFLVNRVMVTNCTCKVTVTGLRVNNDVAYSAKFFVTGSPNVTFGQCYAYAASTSASTMGFHSESGGVVCTGCRCDNLYGALYATLAGRLYSSGLTGSGNSVTYRGMSGGMFMRGANSVTANSEYNLTTGAVLFPAAGGLIT